MATSEMAMPGAASGSTTLSDFSVRLASEEFRGPAQYRFELLDADHSSLWRSAVTTLTGGWDTVIHGPMESRDQLPWQWVDVPNDVRKFPSAKVLRVHFVNDDAGDAGDRNLYVGSVSVRGQQSSPVSGSQVSDCAPDNAAEAGDLYCNGYVDIVIPDNLSANLPNQETGSGKQQVQYASKHVEWSGYNKNNGAMNVRLVFQDVRFDGKHWPVFSAWYRETSQDKLALWMQNYDCWPDCLEQWPDCAWIDDQDPSSVTVHIPAEGAYSENAACHINALSDNEALMLDGLLLQATRLLQEALVGEQQRFPATRSGVKRGLQAMINRFSDPLVQKRFAQTTATGRTAVESIPEWVEDASVKRPYPSPTSQKGVPVLASNLEQRTEQIQRAGFSWPSVFAPGIALSALPGWENNTSVQQTGESLRASIKQWLLNPAYQVY